MPEHSKTKVLRVTYDPEVDAAYRYLTGSIEPGGVDRTITATGSINLDFDKAGCLLGIELLSGALLHPALAALAEKPDK